MAVHRHHYHSGSGKFMRRIDVHCLHGTFQDASAWRRASAWLRGGRVRVVAEEVVPPEAGGPWEWAERFCAEFPPIGEEATVPARALLGYSLGGRLAMHALLSCRAAWSAAVFVAAHPGDPDPAERERRRRRDAEWARRCRSEPLARVLAAWDRQPVFAGRPNPAPRAALDPERQARLLEAFSRGRQEDLRPRLVAARLPPILYVTGSEDRTYAGLGRDLEHRLPSLVHVQIHGAGHRVPWERPEEFAAAVRAFLESTIEP